MSRPLNRSEIVYLQRVCALCGLFKGNIDGRWSNELDKAESELDAERRGIRIELGEFDPRTERNIVTLIPPAQRAARKFMVAAKTFRFPVRIISGSRTYEEQEALYAIGRTVELDRGHVTNARGGHSNHNFGLAWDVGIFEINGRYMTGETSADHAAYKDLAELTKKAVPNLEWGGDWTSFKDAPHYQLAVGTESVDKTREIFESGRPLVLA